MEINTDKISETSLSKSDEQEKTVQQNKGNFNGVLSLRVQKWLQIFFVTLITLGPFICSYGISSVKEGFKEEFGLNDFQFNSMQSAMSFAACAFTLFSGLLTDKIGIRKSLLTFSILCLTGYVVQLLGVYFKIFYIQCIGQALGYINLNGLCVIQGPLISRWVDKKDYGFCLSITFLSVRLADVISSWTYPPIYEKSGHLYLSFLLGVILLVSTLMFGAINSYFMDRKAEKRGMIQQVTISDINLNHIKQLNVNYWLMVVIGVFGLSGFYAYYFNSQTILKKFYHIDGITAGRLFSIPFFVSFSSPVFGFFLDRIKNKPLILIFSVISMVFGYTFWAAFYDCQQEECYKVVIPAYILLGIFLSTFTNTVWYCVFLTSSARLSGSAYGIIISLKNLGIALNGMIEGHIMDQKSTLWAIMYPLFLSILCLIFTLVVYFKNRKEQFLSIESKSNLDLEIETKSETENPIIKNEGSFITNSKSLKLNESLINNQS